VKLKFNQEQVDIVKNWSQFDSAWYRDEYPDVKMLAMDPAYHYLWLGQRIGRRPSANFDPFTGRILKPDELLQFIKAHPLSAGWERSKLEVEYARARGNYAHADLINLVEAAVDPRPPSIAVQAHVYYANVIGEIAASLNRMPATFDLYVSVPDESTRRACLEAFSDIAKLDRLDVRIVPNRGRDIAPFVVEFGPTLATYDVVAHVHTKQSLYNKGATDGWRQYIINGLFPSSANICHILNELKSSRYGIIYPQSFYNLPYMAHTWLANKGVAQAWSERFGLDHIPDGYFDFPAGSMFWARTDAIRPLLSADLKWDDFPSEQGQTDGTLAHCIERMLGVVTVSRNFKHGVIADKGHPSWSRWRINQFFERPVQHIYDAIADQRTKVIAFDIFDTLVIRNMLDADYVKKALHDRYTRAGNSNFLHLRTTCEGNARSAKGSDVDIAEIYADIARHDQESAFGYDMNDEIAMEISSVKPRSDVVELFNFAVNSGKRVVLASDMFLQKSSIETMLKNCSVSGWSEFYLSSEIGFRKDRGDMYQHILRAEALEPSELLMVGDNERSDFQIPADMGIRTVHVVKPTNIMRATPRLEGMIPDASEAPAGDQFLFGALAAENFAAVSFPKFTPADMFGSSPSSIGYGLLGPIALAFSQWLIEAANEMKVDRLCFLSREGKFMKLAYDTWAASLGSGIPSDYMLASRRAITVPAINGIDDIYAIARSNNFYGASVDLFLSERYGVTIDERLWAKIEARNIWRRNTPLTIMDQDIDDIVPLLNHIAPLIYERAAIERGNCMKYLDDIGRVEESRCAVVDVGYGGTIQRHLHKLVPGKFQGLYMMANQSALNWGRSAGAELRGCFVAMVDGAPNGISSMLENSFVLEKMLSADDEQLLYYDEGGIPQFRERQSYVDAGSKVRNEMQRGAIKFIEDAVRFRETIERDVTVSPGRAQELFEEFVVRMSDNELECFAALELDDFYCGRGIIA